MSDPISTLVLATGSAFLSKFIGPVAEHLGKLTLERAQQLGEKATSMLTAAGREPQLVQPNLLIPLVQAAVLESEPTLADKWAALLANSADPNQRVAVQPGFTEVLRQLTPIDARVLTHIYLQVPTDFGVTNYSIEQVRTIGFMETLGLTQREFAIGIENLLRLRLCDTALGSKIIPANQELPPPVVASVYPTVFGREFLAAVTPPTP